MGLIRERSDLPVFEGTLASARRAAWPHFRLPSCYSALFLSLPEGERSSDPSGCMALWLAANAKRSSATSLCCGYAVAANTTGVTAMVTNRAHRWQRAVLQ